MKLSFILLFSLIITVSFGQLFPQPNSHWHYETTITMVPGDSYDHYEWVQDTVINNKTYSVVESKDVVTFYTLMDNSWTTYTSKNYNFYFRQSNDTLYMIDDFNYGERFVWKTNPQVGDLWNLGKSRYDNQKTIYCRVDSIKSEMIQGQMSKWIYTTYNLDSLGNYMNVDSEFEYMRKINTVLGPIDGWFARPLRVLNCFNSDSISLENIQGSNCDGDYNIPCTYTTSIQPLTSINIQVYPNPTKDKLVIEGYEGKTIALINSVGKICFNDKIKHNCISIEQLSCDLYSIIIDGKYISKIVKN
jgi:hypothetical protein